MNLLKNKLASKLMLVAAMLLGSGTLFAANKIYLGALPAIQTYDEVRLPVMLDCDEEAVGAQFNVILPTSLILKDIEFNTERSADHMAQAGIKNSVPTFLVVSPSYNSFVGTTGVIAYLRVKVADGALKVPSTSPIRLESIKISGANGPLVQGESDEKMISIGEVSKIEASVSSNVVNPNGKLTVSVGLNNTVVAQGMQLDVQLPEGFSFDCSANGLLKITNGPRLTLGSTVQGKPKGNKVTILAYNLSNKPVIDKDDFGSGEALFSFDVVAPAEFAAKSEIVISNVVVSLPGSEGIESAGEGMNIEIVNGAEAKAAADAKVAELKEALAAALAEIAEKYADVKDQFTGEEINANIAALEQAIAAAYEDHSLSTAEKYNEVMAPAEEIAASIAALVPAAEAMVGEAARVKANEEAYKATTDAIAALEAELAAAVEAVKDNADYDVTADQKAAADLIAAAKTAAEEAYKAVETEGKYEYALDAEPIKAAIAAIATNAAKADADAKEAARVAANKAAYEADLAKIAPFETNYATEAAKVAQNYPDFDATEVKAAAKKAIDDQKAQAAAALKAVEAEGEYKNTVDTEAMATAIAAIETAAKKFQADKDAAAAEAARVAANQKAYEAELAVIAGLQTELDNAVKAVADNKEYDVTADKAAADKLIADAKAAAKAALDAVAKEGNYAPVVKADAIKAAIAKIAENADKAALEAARVKANEAAAEADNKAIAALEAKLADALAEVAKTYPDYDATADKAAADKLIAEAKEAVKKALEAVAKEGNYASPVKAEPIEAAIAAISANAKADADKKAEEALKAANEAAKAKADAAVAELNKALAAALETIKKECPAVADQFDGANVNDAIKSLEKKIDEALANATLAEKYDEVMAPAANINELIDALVKEAKDAQKAAEDEAKAEADRVAANKAAQAADEARIAAMEQKLNDEVTKLEALFAELGITEPQWLRSEKAAIMEKILGHKDNVSNEADRVAEEGNYKTQVTDSHVALMNELIAAYVDNVKTSGIDSIIVDGNSGKVRIYTIDGVQHDRLVPGVNIIVKEDGTTTKVYVK